MCHSLKILASVLFVVVPTGVMADVVVIPLTITSPDFPATLESAEFEFDFPLAAVSQISLQLQGTFQEVIYVNVSNPWQVGTHPVYLDLYLGGGAAGEWVATERHQFPAGEGDFTFDTVLCTDEQGFDSSLLDGIGRIGLNCGPSTLNLPTGQFVSAMSSWGSVAAASVVVTFDPSVSAEEQAWGSIKALYR